MDMDTKSISSSTTSFDSEKGSGQRGVLNRRAAVLVLCALTALVVLFLLDHLFMPKYSSEIYEGALIGEYYTSEKNHDLIIIGDCEVYENLSPITLWEDFGITSYVRGSPQQLIWQSYYLLEDTLRYEKPKAIVFSVLAMKYGKPQSEAYNRLTLDGMRFSPSKIAAVKASMTEGEDILSYLFPLLRYHERWKSLSPEDVRGMFSKKAVSFNGFMMRCDEKPLGTLPSVPKLPDYTIGEECWKYLEKMRTLCEENGIRLVLLKAPSMYPHWYPEWDKYIREYAERHGLLYINALQENEDIGVDWQRDTYDAGLHLNRSGAEKFSKYLGGVLKEAIELKDWRADEELCALWEQKRMRYYELAAIQLQEIETMGKISSLVY